MSILTLPRGRPAALAIAVVLVMAPANADDLGELAGRWIATGADPDGAAYDGSVLLAVAGDGLVYEGEMDGETYRGFGIWHAPTGTLALDFVEEGTGRAGLSHFVLQDGRLTGRWLYTDQPGELGVEVWTRPDG